MATATASVSAASLLTKGDYVTVTASRHTCFVQDVENNLGFNVYICVDMDSGVLLRKSRFELEKIQGEMVDLPDIMFEQPQVPALDEKPMEEETKRFHTLSDQELNTLAENRNSHMTRKQTCWAIKIFRGRSRSI